MKTLTYWRKSNASSSFYSSKWWSYELPWSSRSVLRCLASLETLWISLANSTCNLIKVRNGGVVWAAIEVFRGYGSLLWCLYEVFGWLDWVEMDWFENFDFSLLELETLKQKRKCEKTSIKVVLVCFVVKTWPLFIGKSLEIFIKKFKFGCKWLNG